MPGSPAGTPTGEVADFFIQRMVLPVRGERDRVVGMIGRDVSGALRAKYLNTPTTAIYDKGRHLYRPSRAVLFPGNIVVVEGAIDALAIEAAAADSVTKSQLSARQALRLPPSTALKWPRGPRRHRFFVPTVMLQGGQRHFGGRAK